MIYKLNGKEYEFNKEITFGELLKIEKAGVSLAKIEEEPLNQAVALASYVTGLKKDEVEKEIEAHIKNGGSIADILTFLEVLIKSDFFK